MLLVTFSGSSEGAREVLVVSYVRMGFKFSPSASSEIMISITFSELFGFSLGKGVSDETF